MDSPNSLDVGYKWHLHCERHLGVAIDLIDPVNYLVPTRPPPLDPEDQALLEWKGVGTGGADGSVLGIALNLFYKVLFI